MLALPDDVLLAKVLAWADELDPTAETWDTIREYFVMTGYQVQSTATRTVYGSLDDLFDAEEDAEEWTTLPPTPAAIRQAISTLPSDDVYHVLVAYLGEVLSGQPLSNVWDAPPALDDRGGGYDFMQYCAIYLRALAG